MRREPGFTDRDTLVAVTTLSFDIAGLELYLPLTVGGRLVIASREIASDGCRLGALITEVGATVMQATPATWRLFLEADWLGNRQLRILCGGEALPRALANQLLERCGSLWNMYGPTETTIWSTTKKIDSEEGPVYLGQPLANTHVYILDGHLNPVPVGVPGELHIGGAGVARGYRNRPELTAKKFIKDPFRDEPAARLYKTGDLVRYWPDGNIEFLGRLDHQVKIRGFRIEPGEIESALGSYPGVRVVLAWGDAPGEKRLVAYLAADPRQELPISELRRFLKKKLPNNMIPSAFVRLEAFPRTPNGKVDRKMLPAPEQERPQLSEVFVVPRTPDEESLAGIWARTLGLERVGVHDNFFELGGHSLLATRVIHHIREELQTELPLRALFEAPTVAGLTERLREIRQVGPGRGLPPLQSVSRHGELPLSFAQQRLWFMDQLESGSASYNIPTAYRLAGALNVVALERAFEEILRRHEVLRTSFPSRAGRPLLAFAPPGLWALPVEDLSDQPEPEREAEALRRANAETQRPFDLARGPLLRTRLLRLADRDMYSS
jgi:hypothetical protein